MTPFIIGWCGEGPPSVYSNPQTECGISRTSHSSFWLELTASSSATKVKRSVNPSGENLGRLVFTIISYCLIMTLGTGVVF